MVRQKGCKVLQWICYNKIFMSVSMLSVTWLNDQNSFIKILNGNNKRLLHIKRKKKEKKGKLYICPGFVHYRKRYQTEQNGTEMKFTSHKLS